MFRLMTLIFSFIISFRTLLAFSGFMLIVILGDAVFAQKTATTGQTIAQKLVVAAVTRTHHKVIYDPAYVAIKYPMGDVPPHTGVCSDVIIRSYRSLGIDLQELVHQDMLRAFGKYPRRWGHKRTDKNIDHRRVPNLRVFFARHGKVLKISKDPADYKPGDLVTWDLSGNAKTSLTHTKLPHIGIVSDQDSLDGARPLIVHNIGEGPKLNDMLFDYKITGHYRYAPKS